MRPLVGVVMGSASDWEVMESCVATLEALGLAAEARVLSAHRTPEATAEWARSAAERGIAVVVAAAGGAAHLAGAVAAHTTLPVLGVPIESRALSGLDSLLSTVQMPAGVPVGTLAIGRAGAVNAALLAASILALGRPEIAEAVRQYRRAQTQKVLAESDPRALARR